MPKNATHPLIKELALGMGVEDLIREYFSDYGLSDFARRHLPRLIREIVDLNNKALRFAVRLELDEISREPVVRLMSYTCQSDITLTYESEPPLHSQTDCVILNDIVRRLYGINRKDPKAMHTQGFVKTIATAYCSRCGKTECERYEQSLTANNHYFRYRIFICQGCNKVVTASLGKTLLRG